MTLRDGTSSILVRVIIDGALGKSVAEYSTAKDAAQAAAKALHHGHSVRLEDETGLELSSDQLAELVLKEH